MNSLLLALVMVSLFHHHKPNHSPTPTLQQRAAVFVKDAQDTVDGYKKDERAARYERVEIERVQEDIDKFNPFVPEEKLWVEIDGLVADLLVMSSKDDEVARLYEL